MAFNLNDLECLRKYATDRQLEFITAVQEHGNVTNAEKALGVSQGLIARSMRALKCKSIEQGEIPELGIVHPLPNPLRFRKASVYFKETPESPAHWLKIDANNADYNRSIIEAVQEAASNPYPLQVMPMDSTDYDTDNVYWINIGDGHLNMISHESQTGANFDIDICERELTMAIQMAIEQIPPCEKIVLQDGGDFTHFENFKAMTEASGHQMDYDKPFPDMIKIYTKLTRYIIELCLTKAKYVDFIANQGNHSRTNDIWMAHYIRDLFAPTGRVNVMDNSSPFIAYRQGKTFVLCHHGDKIKADKLAALMATDFKEDWGETEYHYIDTFHVHTNVVRNEMKNGAIFESFNVLAGMDKYCHDGGWRSRRCLTIIKRSREYGEKGRWLVDIREVWDRLIDKFGKANIYVPKPKRAYVG